METITPAMLREAVCAPGWNKAKAIELLEIHPRTWVRWMRGLSPIPRAPYMLLRLLARGELPQGGETWEGWRFVRGFLVSPENIEFSAGEVRALPIQYARIAELERLVRSGESLIVERHFAPLRSVSGRR